MQLSQLKLTDFQKRNKSLQQTSHSKILLWKGVHLSLNWFLLDERTVNQKSKVNVVARNNDRLGYDIQLRAGS